MTMLQPRGREPRPLELPPYPNSQGHAVANQLEEQSKGYSAAAESLRTELRRAEEAMLRALEAQDRRTSARDRISALARGRGR